MGKKKNRNALSPNAEGVRRGTVCAEDRAPKARGVSMQLGGRLRERCKLSQRVRVEPCCQTTFCAFFGLKMLYLVRPSMQLGILGENCKLPQRVRAEPGRQTTFGAFLFANAIQPGGLGSAVSYLSFNTARVSGELCKLTQRVLAEPGRQTTFGAFWSENALSGKALAS